MWFKYFIQVMWKYIAGFCYLLLILLFCLMKLFGKCHRIWYKDFDFHHVCGHTMVILLNILHSTELSLKNVKMCGARNEVGFSQWEQLIYFQSATVISDNSFAFLALVTRSLFLIAIGSLSLILLMKPTTIPLHFRRCLPLTTLSLQLFSEY